jgi:glucokinase
MTIESHKGMVLAGDIGGTKTNLGLFSHGKTRPIAKIIETFSSQDAPNLENIIERFIERHAISVTSACFGVAGPVVNRRSKITNLPWDIYEDRIKRHFRWPKVRLINDVTATALSVPLLNRQELVALNRARIRKDQNLALIASGTGLGAAFLIFQNGGYIPISSEGGHADFAPTNEEEMALWRYLRRDQQHVSIERVLAGPGLINIYAWLKDSGRYREPAFLATMMKDMDPAKAITQTALEGKNPLCTKALDTYVSIFGAVSGNLALTGMGTGGVFLGGGIPPKILPILKKGIFMKAFMDKGRFKELLEKIPVRVILNDKAALLGAAYCALHM